MADNNKREVKVVTFNIFGMWSHSQRIFQTLFKTFIYDRFTYIADYFNNSDIDILALQEVNSYRQLRFLRARLSTYPYVYYSKYVHGPRGGIVTFSRIPFEKVTYKTFRKSGVYWNKSFIAHLIRRGILIGKVRGLPLLLINTHLTHNIDHDYTEKSRFLSMHKAQLNQLAETLGTFDKKQAVILCGDFNIPKGTKILTNFQARSQLHDAFSAYTIPATHHEEFAYEKKPLGRVDFIFFYKKFTNVTVVQREHLFEEKVILANAKTEYVSDHVALCAKFRI